MKLIFLSLYQNHKNYIRKFLLQSADPSQCQETGTQTPEDLHLKCFSKLHWFGSIDGQPNSSDPSLPKIWIAMQISFWVKHLMD